MLLNLFKIAFRNIRKHKTFTFINIFGLTAGLAGFLLIFFYIKYELEFDTFHKDADKIYRVISNVELRNGNKMFTCLTSPLMKNYLESDFPQITAATRLAPSGNMLLAYGEKRFYEENFVYVDSTFLDVFDFKALESDGGSPLKRAKSIVMTKSIAKKYFGDESPIGKVINIDNGDDFTVTGILEDIPANSHISFEIVAFDPTLRRFNLQNWGALSLYTYVKLQSAGNAEEVRKGFDEFKKARLGDPLERIFNFNIEPMLGIHLYSDREHDLSNKTDIEQIYIFGIIAVLIIIVACINFMNLSTAKSSLRSLEIGIRKVLGATRKSLIYQHLGESLILTGIALSLGILLFYLVLPHLNSLNGSMIESNIYEILGISLVLLLFVGLFAGSYPAVFLSGFKPITVLKGIVVKSRVGNYIRKGLVIFQFAVTTALLLCTAIVYQQMEYIRNKNLGYNKEQVVIIPLRDEAAQKKMEVIKNSFLQLPEVQSLSLTAGLPGQGTAQRAYDLPDSAGRGYILHTLHVDDNFLNTLGIKLIEGRNFSKGYSGDFGHSVIVNEAAVKRFGWKEPIGKELTWQFNTAMNDTSTVRASVIGVVKDFHFQSLFEMIEPIVLRYDNETKRFLAVKIKSEDIPNTIASLEGNWNELCPYSPFDSYFMDESFDQIYNSEQKLGKLFFAFTCLAIIISCLGLFGLSAFTVEQRKKEIGLRKVLGASVAKIVMRLSKEFSLWVIIANIIAFPVGYLIMSDWINKFAYRIDITAAPFIFSALLALVIALFVVGAQTVKAALSNPINALKEE